MGKKYLYAFLFLVVLAIAGGVYVISTGRAGGSQVYQTSSPSATIESTVEPIASGSAKPMMEDKLIILDEKVGTGVEAVTGKKVTVNYVGTLLDGTKFDSSYDRSEPFAFNLGAGEVIKGWDQGVVGMKVGGKRKLTIPSSLGYGETGAGGVIPPNATLIFEIELLKVE